MLTLHSSHGYIISSVCDKLTDGLQIITTPNSKVLWLKVGPLKLSIFAWRLGLNRIPTKDYLFKRRVLRDVKQAARQIVV